MGFIGDLFTGAGEDLTVQNKFRGQMPDIQTFDFVPAVQQSFGDIYETRNRQDELAVDLRNAMAGIGPDPAQAEYQKNLNQIAAQQAGAISSAKGISPGLAAQLIARQSGQVMQQGAADAAIRRAQQQIDARNALQNLYNQQAGSAVSAQQNVFGAQAAQNQAINTGSLGAQGLTAGAMGQNAQAANERTGGLLGGVGSALGSILKINQGGIVPDAPGPEVAGDHVANDKVMAMLSPGEIVVPRSLVDDPEAAKKFIEQLKKAEKKGKVTYNDVLKAKRGAA